MRRPCLLLAALLLAVTAGYAEAAGDAPNDAVRWAHPALWRIESGNTTVYLFGSVHIIPGNVAWSDPQIDTAIRASDVFVFEASLAGQALADMRDVVRTQGTLPRGETLRGLLSPVGLTDYIVVLKELGIPPQSLDRLRPWLALFYIGLRHTTTRATAAPGKRRSRGHELRPVARA